MVVAKTNAPHTRPSTVAELRNLTGVCLGPTGWYEVTQERVDDFARVTHDMQWIHLDTERARGSEFGGTIAHGLLTLSLGPKFTEELISFENFGHALNYGFERVRFPAPVPVGSRVRMSAAIAEIADVPGGAQVSIEQTFECDRAEKPVCVSLALARLYERAGD